MAKPIIMPRQGQSVESCIITQWHVKEGDKVKEGDVLFSYETDKASFDEESSVSGTVLKILFEEDDDVEVLKNVCIIGDEGEDISEFLSDDSSSKETETTALETETKTEMEEVKEEEVIVTVNNDKLIKISPRAKNLADKNGVDFTFAKPTGPNGRIIERDIERLISEGPKYTKAAMGSGVSVDGTGIGGRITEADTMNIPVKGENAPQAEFEDVKLPNIRKVIAKAMLGSLTTTAQLTLNSSFDASEIMAYRAKVKKAVEVSGMENVTINDIIMFAVSRTILEFKDLNAHFLDDKMRYFANVNLGIAVDTPRGLLVPTIFNINKKSLVEISKEAKDTFAKCKEGTISPDYLQGASFTITNLGSAGIESFTPVLNAPQTGILGINTIEYKTKKVNGEFKNYPAMGLSLTFDHRALDGAPAAKFLQKLSYNLENFSLLLAM